MGLAIFAAFINNAGVNLQKLAWTKKQQLEARQEAGGGGAGAGAGAGADPNVYKTLWGLGMVMIVLASFCDFAALAFGPQSVIAPLGSLTMVANAFIAPWMHGEKLHKQVLMSTAIIILGCAIAVATASHANEICDIDKLFALYSTPRFIAYAVVLILILVAGSMAIKRCEQLLEECGPDSPEYQAVFKFHRVSYAGLSGICGAQSVLFAKSVDELLVSSLRGGRVFLAYPGTYVVTACMAGSIVVQIYYLNLGLARFESLYNVPVFTSTWIVGTVLGGGVFYGEFSDFSATQAFFFPFGVFLCVAGVFFLSQGDADDDEDDASARIGLGDGLSRQSFDDTVSAHARGAAVQRGGGRRERGDRPAASAHGSLATRDSELQSLMLA